MEKHAAPNNLTLEYPEPLQFKPYNIQPVKKILFKIKKFRHLNDGSYYGILPRLLIDIKDPNILAKAKEENPEFYMNLNPQYRKPKNSRYFNTINNIKVSDIHCYCENGRCYKKTQFEKILGKNVPNQDEIMCYAPCRHTIFAAAKRQIKCAPTPDPEVAREFVEFAKNMIEKYVGENLTHFGYSFADWYNHLPLNKQKNMLKIQEIIDKFRELKIDPEDYHKLLKQHYQGICKIELQDVDGKPRMVCSIPDLVKYVMGPITWQLEEIMADNFPGYCGGKNLTEMADEINNYIDAGFTKVVEGDGSAFDNTQDVQLKEIDRYIYRRVMHSIYHVEKELFLNISQSYYKVMDVQDRDPHTKKLTTLMTYYVLGTVFSGDCDTTLANTLRMALYNHFVNYKMGLELDVDYVLFSKGDDFTIMYKNYVNDIMIQQYYYKYFLPNSNDPSQIDTRQYGLGQICKFLNIGDVTSFTFCSLRAWIKDDYGHITLTRDPKKLYTLGKYSRKTKHYNIYQRIKYMFTQAAAIKASYSGIHVFDVYSNAFIREAHKLYKQLNAKQTVKLNEYLNKAELSDSRFHTNLDDVLYGDIHAPLIYNIQHRHKQYNIKGTYWETMQAIERINTRRYTQQELLHINAQINAEFDPNMLQAVLA